MRYAKKLGITYEKFNDSQDAKFRQWYFGGLVLARKPGVHEGRFTLFDIKSAYPFAMLHPHPGGKGFRFNAGEGGIKPQSFVLCRGGADCFLRRTKAGNSYGGEGDFYVTGWEFLLARKLELFRGEVVFSETPLSTIDFKSYVNHFFDQKAEAEQKGDKAGRLIAKIMLNSLYGKFAQRNDRFRDYFLWPQNHPCPAGFLVEAEYDDFKLKVISKESPHRGLYNVATAASITGFVRAMLMKAIYETDPYYCDTDSVITDTGLSFPTGDRLGNWGVEVEGDLLYIAGKKLYALRLTHSCCDNQEAAKSKGYVWHGHRAWKVASKGCRLTPGEMLRICQGESIDYKNAAPSYSLLNSPHFVQRCIRATATAND